MSLSAVLALLLASAALAGVLRWGQRWRRRPDARPAPWRMAALLLLQIAAALLLYRVLDPPERPVDDATLAVMTAGAQAADLARVPRGIQRVALPEVDREIAVDAGATRMPDLATALRAHPGTTRLEVLGQGLEARDVPAARGLAIGFAPPPLPRGFVEVQPIGDVVAGGRLRVAGRIHGVDGGRVELRDPGGALLDQAVPGSDGRFRLEGRARVAGPALWTLRLSAPDQAGDAMTRIDEVAVPVDAARGHAPRLLLLAGAPGAEVKYLRRWAADAGVVLHSRVALGGGAALGDGPVGWDPEALAGFDLVVLDERAWAGLGAGARDVLLHAVEGGLGLLFRITAPPDAATHQALRQLGFSLEAPEAPLGVEVRLEAATRVADVDHADAGDAGSVATPASTPAPAGEAESRVALPVLARQPRVPVAAGSVPLLRDAAGVPLARWRAAGRGRIAVWNLDQTFRLVLAGHGHRHADLWSDAVGTLARASAPGALRVAGPARVGERAVLCNLPPEAALVAANGSRLHPLPDPTARGCAAVWPRAAGWHRVEGGGAADHLYVHERSGWPGVDAMARGEATQRLAAQDGVPSPAPTDRHTTATATQRPTVSGPRWPWFLGWLAAMALLWWLERAVRGRSPPRAAPHA